MPNYPPMTPAERSFRRLDAARALLRAVDLMRDGDYNQALDATVSAMRDLSAIVSEQEPSHG